MREYLISIISAGIVCALITTFFHKDNTIGRIINLLCGVYMVLTIISPWSNINNLSIPEMELQNNEIQDIINEGEQYADKSQRQVITEQCRAYIVEKASRMGVKIDAEVLLNQGDTPTPYAVTITGSVSPYIKLRIEELLTEDLGIPKERQVWK